MRNLQVNEDVPVEPGGETHAGTAQILQADTPEDLQARDLPVRKRPAGRSLDDWGRFSCPVVVEFLNNDAATPANGRQPVS